MRDLWKMDTKHPYTISYHIDTGKCLVCGLAQFNDIHKTITLAGNINPEVFTGLPKDELDALCRAIYDYRGAETSTLQRAEHIMTRLWLQGYKIVRESVPRPAFGAHGELEDL